MRKQYFRWMTVFLLSFAVWGCDVFFSSPGIVSEGPAAENPNVEAITVSDAVWTRIQSRLNDRLALSDGLASTNLDQQTGVTVEGFAAVGGEEEKLYLAFVPAMLNQQTVFMTNMTNTVDSVADYPNPVHGEWHLGALFGASFPDFSGEWWNNYRPFALGEISYSAEYQNEDYMGNVWLSDAYRFRYCENGTWNGHDVYILTLRVKETYHQHQRWGMYSAFTNYGDFTFKVGFQEGSYTASIATNVPFLGYPPSMNLCFGYSNIFADFNYLLTFGKDLHRNDGNDQTTYTNSDMSLFFLQHLDPQTINAGSLGSGITVTLESSTAGITKTTADFGVEQPGQQNELNFTNFSDHLVAGHDFTFTISGLQSETGQPLKEQISFSFHVVEPNVRIEVANMMTDGVNYNGEVAVPANWNGYSTNAYIIDLASGGGSGYVYMDSTDLTTTGDLLVVTAWEGVAMDDFTSTVSCDMSGFDPATNKIVINTNGTGGVQATVQ